MAVTPSSKVRPMARRAHVTRIGRQNCSRLVELLVGIEFIELELRDADAVAAAIREPAPNEAYYVALRSVRLAS
jgi:hypothetical protein